MTDERFVYHQDIREKKTASRGARAKRNGSKSKKCSLPSDTLTHTQWKRRNSEVQTYNISLKHSYEQFKNLPADLQSQYLTRLIETYNVALSEIAVSMGAKTNTLWWYTDKYKIPHPPTTRSPRLEPAWTEFLEGKRNTLGIPLYEPVEDTIDEGGIDTLPSPKSPEKRTIYPSDGELVFDCTPAEMVDYIMRSLNSDETYTWRVFFARREEDAHV